MTRKIKILAIANNLAWIIIILTTMYLQDNIQLTLLLANIIFCLLVAVIFFIVSRLRQIENSKRIEEYKTIVQDCQKQLRQKNEIIDQKNCECNANKNKHLQELIELRDIMYALKTYIKLSALKSAIGNLRSNNKEKAETKIVEVQSIIDEIIQNTDYRHFQFLAEIEYLETEYEKIMKDYKSRSRNDAPVY